MTLVPVRLPRSRTNAPPGVTTNRQCAWLMLWLGMRIFADERLPKSVTGRVRAIFVALCEPDRRTRRTGVPPAGTPCAAGDREDWEDWASESAGMAGASHRGRRGDRARPGG